MYERDLTGPEGMASEAPDIGERIDTTPPPPRPRRTRLILALTLLAFVGGVAAMAWIMTHWPAQRGAEQAIAVAPSLPAEEATRERSATPPDSVASVRPPTLLLSAEQQDLRLLDLEQRMARVAVAAQAASGYANRAEAMMIAFAARRALDAGQPLGYIEGQLRLLFGEAQPKAVATIVNAAAEPVTIASLRARLAMIGNELDRGEPGESWWDGAMRELRGLAIIRRADAPSPLPSERLIRARIALEAGQIDDAMNEIAALPSRPATTAWLERARRYNEARRALDVIEAAAILEPRAQPIIAPTLPTDQTGQQSGRSGR